MTLKSQVSAGVCSVAMLAGLYGSSSPWMGLGVVSAGVFGYSFLFCFKTSSYSLPHPVFWRLVDAAALVYLCYMCFIASLSRSQAVAVLGVLDPVNLGKPLPEKSYAEVCEIYDASQPETPWHNISDRFDLFVAAHFFGWLVKAWIVRDRKLLWIASVLFELVELSLKHLLPNFEECLWDVLVFDLFGANWLGLELGLFVARKLNLENFRFTGGAQTRRLLLAQVALVLLTTLIDLNLFFIKFLLYIPTSHWIMCMRTLLFVGISASATKQLYRFARPHGAAEPEASGCEAQPALPTSPAPSTAVSLETEESPSEPPTTLVLGLAILSVEVLAIAKNGNGVFTQAAPLWVKVPWTLALGVFGAELVRRRY